MKRNNVILAIAKKEANAGWKSIKATLMAVSTSVSYGIVLTKTMHPLDTQENAIYL